MDGDFSEFDAPEDFEPTRLDEVANAQPERVGRYRILRKLGEGGMGLVYEAEQERPVRRRVALKVIKLGMDTEQVIARFESERQALALMSHVNIARVYDAGATDEGRPFFAMEFVKGIPIDECCKRYHLDTEARLRLLIQVCEGVQHAHQKGIIHRDLKPSNVLVSDEDGRRVPKIIDFGIAKAVERRLTERSLFTEMGQLVGTPEYMSPEQAEMSGIDIDTRTDVYLLGVLLYELLTGELPFSTRELRKVGFNEFRRKVLEEDPPKPSTRLTIPGGGERRVQRVADLPALSRQLKGDLDWITMKALEKDRTRRYASASELAADIRRHLEHEPVQAGPPGKLYRARKFVRRHRTGVTFAAVLFVLLAAFAATMAVQRKQVAAERDDKELARAQAVTEAAAALEVADFLEGMFSVADPWEALGDEVTAREILDRGADRIRDELRDQPLVQARMMRVIGRVYGNMSMSREATELLEEALRIQRRHLDANDLELASTMQDLAGVLSTGDLHRSRTFYEQSLDVRLHRLGPDHPDVAASMNCVANALNAMGESQLAAEYWDDAYVIWDKLDDFANMAKIQNNRGLIDLNNGDPASAVELFDEALALHRRTADSTNPLVALFLDNRGRAELALGNLGSARADYGNALRIRRKIYGDADPFVALSMLRLAMIDLRQGRQDQAAEGRRQALEVLEETNSLDAPSVVYELASYSAISGDHEAALRDLRRAVIDHGLYGAPRLLHDPNLESLRGDPEFESIVTAVRRRSGGR